MASRHSSPLGLEAVDWQDQNAQLLTGLRSQSISSILIQGLVIVAVALGIGSTLAIFAVQKARQIGILKALGMRDVASGAIFVAQAALLGVAGSLLGVGLGSGLTLAFDGFASGSESLFPVTVDPTFMVIGMALGTGVAVLSAAVPFRATNRLDPIGVIQDG